MIGERRRRSPFGGVLAACLAVAMFGVSGAAFLVLAVLGVAALVAAASLSARRARIDVTRRISLPRAAPPPSSVKVRHLGVIQDLGHDV